MAELLAPNVVNVLDTYGNANRSELRQGLRWYAAAADEATRRLGLSREAACGIVAALSPQCGWERNVDHAELFLAGHRFRATRDMLGKAGAIRDGAAPLDVLGGSKVRAFYACLVDQSTDDVCVDRHALCVWRAIRTTDSKSLSIGKRLYRVVADDYRTAASMLGIKPHQLQATTWLTWRRLEVPSRYLHPLKSGRKS